MEEIIKYEADLYKYDGEDRVISCLDHKRELGDKIEYKWELKSGISGLDSMINGFYPGELTVMSGITGEGKTLFCQTLTRNFYTLEGKPNAIWFSYEVIFQKFYKQFGPIVPDFIVPRKLKDKNMKWIRERIHEAVVKFDIKVVFIDHLHYLFDMFSGINPSLTIGNICRDLVNISHDLNVHIFLVAHMAKVDINTEPEKGHCRDSSLIEQEADNIFYIWRSRKYDNGGTLKIAKSRGTGVWNKKIGLIKKGNYFEEMDYAYGQTLDR